MTEVDRVPVQSPGDPGFQPISAFEAAKDAVDQIIWKVKVGEYITGKDFAGFLTKYINENSLGQMSPKERQDLAECLDSLYREAYGRNVHDLDYEIKNFKILLQCNDRGQKSQSDSLLSRIWKRLFGSPSVQKPTQASPAPKTTRIFGLVVRFFQRMFGKR